MTRLHFAAPLCGWLAAHGTSCIELVASVFGAVSVFLSVRQKLLAWPTAIVNVALYALIFGRAGYYSDAGLQLVYLGLSVYGWYHWRFGGADRTELPVTRARRREWVVAGGGALVLWLVLGLITSRLPHAQRPWIDAALTSTSLAAQWLMTRKVLENWLLWIAVDVIYVPLWYTAGLPLTAALYAVFLVLAVMGWVQWRRDLCAREAGA